MPYMTVVGVPKLMGKWIFGGPGGSTSVMAIDIQVHMKMIFEIRDLNYATPATATRAGIVCPASQRFGGDRVSAPTELGSRSSR